MTDVLCGCGICVMYCVANNVWPMHCVSNAVCCDCVVLLLLYVDHMVCGVWQHDVIGVLYYSCVVSTLYCVYCFICLVWYMVIALCGQYAV